MSKATEVDIALGILDHQLVDADGRNCGKVDDLEIAGLASGSPEVVEIVVGGNAWKTRGRLGRLAATLSGNAVHELRLNRGDERWAPLLRRLPGS